MTSSVITALSDIDESFFIHYTDKTPQKKKKYIRYINALAAAVLIVTVSCGLFLFIQNKTKVKDAWNVETYETLDTMLGVIEQRYKEHYTLLSKIETDQYDTVSCFCLKKQDMEQKTASSATSEVFVLELRRNTEKYILIYTADNNENPNIPEKYKSKTPYAQSFSLNGTKILYNTRYSKIEGEFKTETGYYKIICYSNVFDDFYAFIKSVFDK